MSRRRKQEPSPPPPPEPRRLRRFVSFCSKPIRRMWTSDDPLDDFALVHMASAAGDAAVAVALAESVFFALPVGQARVRVALYLLMTVAPLALAAPLLVPLLDRAGPRRLISFCAAVGRAVLAVYLATRASTWLLFPLALGLMVLSKVHSITKNGLTVAYAPRDEGFVRANARLGRVAAVGAVIAVLPAAGALKIWGAAGALYFAVGVYLLCSTLVLRLPHPRVDAISGKVGKRGRVPGLSRPASGTAVLRAASGFLLFLLAFALRRSGATFPRYWIGVLAGSATVGKYLGDFIAPRLPRNVREEVVVVGSIVGAGLAAVLALTDFHLWALASFAAIAGICTEFGVLAFQSLMQRTVPENAFGRVFVRYEVIFQLAWVAGAFVPSMLPIDFKEGVVTLAVGYLVSGLSFLALPRVVGGSLPPGVAGAGGVAAGLSDPEPPIGDRPVLDQGDPGQGPARGAR